jgi:hypothetical protein
MKRAAIIFLAMFCMEILALAQKPNISNAKVQEMSAAGGLKPVFDSIVQKQESPGWIGYRIPVIPKERTLCCFDSLDQFKNTAGCCMGCKMDSEKGGSFSGTVSNCAPPEPFHYAFVFYRAEQKHVEKIRSYSPDCALDFGGLPVYWLENVDPAQSVQLLTDFALADDGQDTFRKKGPANNAVFAIAMHDHPAADQALEKLIQPDRPEFLRENVAFWLGVERGKKGLELLRKYVKEDANDRFREKGTFAFSQSKEPEAIKDLIGMARNDPSSRVRSQAIFWLAQIGGRKEGEQITAAIEDDPELAVKKKAVFALSQMKDGEGVPLLINVAKTNKNPAVRKEAIRWLGMTNDPRALDFLEQILTK